MTMNILAGILAIIGIAALTIVLVETRRGLPKPRWFAIASLALAGEGAFSLAIGVPWLAVLVFAGAALAMWISRELAEPRGAA